MAPPTLPNELLTLVAEESFDDSYDVLPGADQTHFWSLVRVSSLFRQTLMRKGFAFATIPSTLSHLGSKVSLLSSNSVAPFVREVYLSVDAADFEVADPDDPEQHTMSVAGAAPNQGEELDHHHCAAWGREVQKQLSRVFAAWSRVGKLREILIAVDPVRRSEYVVDFFDIVHGVLTTFNLPYLKALRLETNDVSLMHPLYSGGLLDISVSPEPPHNLPNITELVYQHPEGWFDEPNGASYADLYEFSRFLGQQLPLLAVLNLSNIHHLGSATIPDSRGIPLLELEHLRLKSLHLRKVAVADKLSGLVKSMATSLEEVHLHECSLEDEEDRWQRVFDAIAGIPTLPNVEWKGLNYKDGMWDETGELSLISPFEEDYTAMDRMAMAKGIEGYGPVEETV